MISFSLALSLVCHNSTRWCSNCARLFACNTKASWIQSVRCLAKQTKSTVCKQSRSHSAFLELWVRVLEPERCYSSIQACWHFPISGACFIHDMRHNHASSVCNMISIRVSCAGPSSHRSSRSIAQKQRGLTLARTHAQLKRSKFCIWAARTTQLSSKKLLIEFALDHAFNWWRRLASPRVHFESKAFNSRLDKLAPSNRTGVLGQKPVRNARLVSCLGAGIEPRSGMITVPAVFRRNDKNNETNERTIIICMARSS